MSSQRGRQKKAEKHRKKREDARKTACKTSLPTSIPAMLRLASAAPFGPAWITENLEQRESEVPALAMVVVTRKLPGGLLLAHAMLVDRTCLGVKDAMVAQPMDEQSVLRNIVNAQPADMPMSRCDLLVAQSVVFHAIDFARSLGFEPHPDFSPALLGKRPETLLDTPVCKPDKPYYVSGPRDNSERILQQLARALGPYGSHFTLEAALDDDDDEDDDDDDDDDDEPPREDVFDGLDLTNVADRREAVQILVDMLEGRTFLRWEAVVREENGLPLSNAQADAFDSHFVVSYNEEESTTAYIDDCARPAEPWYESVRRVAPLLVIEHFDTAAESHIENATIGARLLSAVEQNAGDLSLPFGCARPADVIAPGIRHRLRVQQVFNALAGLGQKLGDDVITLAHPGFRGRIEMFAQVLRDNEASMQALGWTMDDLLNKVTLPQSERELLLEGLEELGRA
jgi:hypothetical protein